MIEPSLFPNSSANDTLDVTEPRPPTDLPRFDERFKINSRQNLIREETNADELWLVLSLAAEEFVSTSDRPT